MRSWKQAVVVPVCMLLVLILQMKVVYAGRIAPGLQQAIQDDAEVAFIVRFADRIDPQDFVPPARRRGIQRAELIRALQSKAQASQQQALELLQQAGAKRVTQLWLINALAVRAKANIIQRLANLPGVESIEPDATVQAPVTTEISSLSPAEWNLDAIRAPEFWASGYIGTGVVVASMDTGVDVYHPDLAPRWRGGANSWFDPHGEHATPHDSSGHGTQVMGLMVGGDAGGTTIGVAPGAQWIAVKIFDDAGLSSLSVIHQGFQWLLDPDLNPDTNDSPHVVNNSWGFPELVNQCYTEFEVDIEILKAVGISMVFSAGNQGPDSETSVSPANNPEGYAVGMVDSQLNIGFTSSRGASACGATLYPELVAPGVDVRTTDLTFGGLFPDSYVSVIGTSAAAPHVAGALALLREAYPAATVAELEQALENSANDLGLIGADNDYGYGLVDVVEAAGLLESLPPPPPCTDADADGFFAEANCGTLQDCDDNNAGINPAACDIKRDGIDQDCDGVDRLKGKSCPVN